MTLTLCTFVYPFLQTSISLHTQTSRYMQIVCLHNVQTSNLIHIHSQTHPLSHSSNFYSSNFCLSTLHPFTFHPSKTSTSCLRIIQHGQSENQHLAPFRHTSDLGKLIIYLSDMITIQGQQQTTITLTILWTPRYGQSRSRGPKGSKNTSKSEIWFQYIHYIDC